MIDEIFLKRIRDNYTNYEGNQEFLSLAYSFSRFPYLSKKKVEKCEMEQTVQYCLSILKKIDFNYANELEAMLKEEKEELPIVYVFHSQDPEKNESSFFQNQIYFYKTNTTYDVFYLLHEFTHFLTKGKVSYLDKEILPILMEFIVADELKNDSFLRHRLNQIILDAKSVLFKSEVLKGNFDLNKIQIKYHFSKKEMDTFTNELLYSKKLSFDEEITYINGFYKAFLLKKDGIKQYQQSIKEFHFPDSNYEQIWDEINECFYEETIMMKG